MGQFSVAPETLMAVSGQVTSTAADIAGTLQNLRGTVSPLQSEWTGQAQAQFQQLWEQWETSARSLNEALDGIARLVGQAGQKYGETDAAIASSF